MGLGQWAHDMLELPWSVTALTGHTRLELSTVRSDKLPALDSFPQLKTLDISHCNVMASQLARLTTLCQLEAFATAEVGFLACPASRA